MNIVRFEVKCGRCGKENLGNEFEAFELGCYDYMTWILYTCCGCMCVSHDYVCIFCVSVGGHRTLELLLNFKALPMNDFTIVELEAGQIKVRF